jgi:phenylalanyl-tRNA synthetase beta chain
LSWLREYVDLPDDIEAVAERLAMLGFPVEEIVRRPVITGVVVGKIVELRKHPNADKLQVGQIDIGEDRLLTIATAATNVAQGQVIPVATVGAQLPQLKIEPRTMRGIASEGMMCSADELGLPAEWFVDGIMQLDPDTEIGADVVALFGLDGAVFDVEVTTNRVDAMSIVGLARELAASYEVPLRAPSAEFPPAVPEDDGQAPSVRIKSPDCTRFVVAQFDDTRVAPAPVWMQVRLALAGQRPINNLVDISNYVMLEIGQPLHFYDADRVQNHTLVVRDAKPGERLTTLDGIDRELSPSMLVIADDEHALGVAGVMGGASSEVTASTRSILLESATFTGARIRRASMELGLRSEASSRHEKTLAPATAGLGAARAAQLLVAIGAEAHPAHAFGNPLADASPIALHARDVERLLGIALTTGRIARHLEALGCRVEHDGELLQVTPPAWRRDLAISADLVEEVARMEGYENIPAVLPAVPPHAISSAQYDLEARLAHELTALGYRENISYSLHGSQPFERASRAGLAHHHEAVEVINPLSEDQRWLRESLLPGAIGYLATLDAPARTFEIGHVFAHEREAIVERPMLAFGFAAQPLDEPVWRDSRLLELKGDAEALLLALTGRTPVTERDARPNFHPGKSAVMMIDGHEVGCFGRIDPRLQRAYDARLPLYFCARDLALLPDRLVPVYRPPSKYPSTYRDLALVVALAVPAAEIERVTAGSIGSICTGVRVFDEYRGPQVGEDRKSLAVRVTLQRFDTTITDEEADVAVARALDALRGDLGAVIRE